MTASRTFEDRLLDQLRAVVAANSAPEATRHRPPRGKRLLMAGAGVAAASAAAALVALTGGATPNAWALESQPDGTVTVHIHSLRDAAGLQSGLRAAGIPAVVDYKPATVHIGCQAGAPAPAITRGDLGTTESGQKAESGPVLTTKGAPPAQDGTGGPRPKVTSSVRIDRDGTTTFSIDPGDVKPGQKVFITTSTGSADAVGISVSAAAPDTAPAC
jgi:hypothetical protein